MIAFEKIVASLRFPAAPAMAAIFLLGAAESAFAHKVKIFATADGAKISGYAYYSGGARPRNVTIEVRGPREEKLGEVETNDRGEFVFEAVSRCDHTFVLDLKDGHETSFTVEAKELPDSLPVPGDTGASPVAEEKEAAAGEEQSDTPRSEEWVSSVSLTEVEAVVGKAVSQQIRPLREQLDAFEEKAKLHDILGGVGYIFGLFGIAFYFLGARRKEEGVGVEKISNE